MDGRPGQAERGRPEIDDGDGRKLNRILRRPEDIGNSSGDHWAALEGDLRDNRCIILALEIESRTVLADRPGSRLRKNRGGTNGHSEWSFTIHPPRGCGPAEMGPASRPAARESARSANRRVARME